MAQERLVGRAGICHCAGGVEEGEEIGREVEEARGEIGAATRCLRRSQHTHLSAITSP
jgi:hypothetical protein